MKKFRYLLGVALLIPSLTFAPVLVYAHSDEESASSQTLTATDENKTTVADDSDDKNAKIKDPSTDTTEMKKRVELLKTSLKVSLDAKTKLKIEQKCKPAQTIVKTRETSDKENGSKREVAYDKILENLDRLVTKLKANSIDTTALEAAIATLKTKVETFKTDMTAYRQALADLSTIDCATDPTAFQAALTSTRTAREKVRTSALDIRNHIKTVLKPALQAIRDKIKADKEKEESSTTDDTGGNQ